MNEILYLLNFKSINTKKRKINHILDQLIKKKKTHECKRNVYKLQLP